MVQANANHFWHWLTFIPSSTAEAATGSLSAAVGFAKVYALEPATVIPACTAAATTEPSTAPTATATATAAAAAASTTAAANTATITATALESAAAELPENGCTCRPEIS